MVSLKSLDGLEAQLDAASRAGFPAVELLEEHLADPRAVRANLDVRGLRASTVCVSLTSLRERPGEMVAGARMVGATMLAVCAEDYRSAVTTSEAWRELGRELGALAARLTDTGLRLCYRNHDWELVELPEGSTPLDMLLCEGAQGGLGWQADLGWLARSGGQPAAWLRRYAGRVCSVHVKDIVANANSDGAAEQPWCDIGQGMMDWPDLWGRCLDAGARLFVAGHDRPADPSGFARRSYVALDRLAANGPPVSRPVPHVSNRV